jgi:probable HAF family extracellular repeat protein
MIDAASDLGTLGGTNSSATGINAFGQVTGLSDVAGNTGTHAFRTTATGSLANAEDLGTFGGTQSNGNAINSTGQVVGAAYLGGNSVYHAFRTTSNGQPLVLQDLGTLSGTNSSATGINSYGVVVGVIDPTGASRGFVFDNQMHDLNSMVPAGWTILFAGGINDFGQIVGWGQFQGGGVEAVMLSPIPEPSTLSFTVLAGLVGCRRAASPRPASH